MVHEVFVCRLQWYYHNPGSYNFLKILKPLCGIWDDEYKVVKHKPVSAWSADCRVMCLLAHWTENQVEQSHWEHLLNSWWMVIFMYKMPKGKCAMKMSVKSLYGDDYSYCVPRSVYADPGTLQHFSHYEWWAGAAITYRHGRFDYWKRALGIMHLFFISCKSLCKLNHLSRWKETWFVWRRRSVSGTDSTTLNRHDVSAAKDRIFMTDYQN